MGELVPSPVCNGPASIHRLRVQSPRRALGRVSRHLHQKEFRAAYLSAVCGLLNLLGSRLHGRLWPRFRCSCCGYHGTFFIHTCNASRVAWNSACPNCDSRSRHRGLVLWLNSFLDARQDMQRILHTSPDPVLRRVLSDRQTRVYHTTDPVAGNVDFPEEDIERLSLPDDYYDLVVCSHVLARVKHDHLAVAEIARVLRPEGIAVFTVPGDWTRPNTIQHEVPRPDGQYREYGRDITELISKHFALVEMLDLHRLDRAADGFSHAIRRNDVAFICMKSA